MLAALVDTSPGGHQPRLNLSANPCHSPLLPYCRHRGMDRKDIQRIEFLIRKGRRQLELFSSAEFTAVHVTHAPSQSSGSAAAAAAGKPTR